MFIHRVWFGYDNEARVLILLEATYRCLYVFIHSPLRY